MKHVSAPLFFFLFCSQWLLAGDVFVYVTLKDDNALAIYKLDTLNGDLSLVERFSISGGPTVVTLHPSKKYLYVSQDMAKTLSAYSIDPSNGKPTFLNSIPAVDVSVNLQFDKTNQFLFSVYYNANKATIHSVNANGTLNSTTIRTFSTGTGSNPHAMLTDPSNRFAYVSNKSGEGIQVYPFNSTTGDISVSSLVEYKTPTGTGPRHFVFHTTLPLVYFANELGGSASVYQINQTNGTLTHLQTISTLPAGFSGVNTVADIHMTQNQKFLYVSNRGHNSIAGFRINPITGLLSTLAQYATVSTPRAFAIDPSGKFLFAAGQSSNNLATYRIQSETGVLSLIGSYKSIGKVPSWVSVLEFRNVVTTLEEATTHSDTFHYSPNPSTENSEFSFYLASAQEVTITLYNALGYVVKKTESIEGKQGHNSFLWEGTDHSITKVPTGVYIAVLRGKGVTSSVKILVP